MSPKIFLERFAYTPVSCGMGVFGVMSIPDRSFQCLTVEQDWEDNKPRLSCIPEGMYKVVRGRYNRGDYEAFELKDVPGRSLIKIHRGNTLNDLLGCIAPGAELGFVSGKWAVTKSAGAFSEFMRALEGVDETSITITSVFHQGMTGMNL